MNAIPKNEYARYRNENNILMRMISEELDKQGKVSPDWADTGELAHVRYGLKKLLADMRLKPGLDETEIGREIEKEISLRKEKSKESEVRASRVKNQSKTGE